MAEEFPEAVEERGILYGDLETLIVQQARNVEAWEQVGWNFVHDDTYNILGEANWGPFATELQDNGVEALTSWARGRTSLSCSRPCRRRATSPR